MSLHDKKGVLTMEFDLSQCDCIDSHSLRTMDEVVAIYCENFVRVQYEMSVSGAMRWPSGFHKEVIIDLKTLEMI